MACGVQQIAAQPMQLRLVAPLFGRLDDLGSFSETIQALDRLPVLGVGLGEQNERKRRHYDRSGGAIHRERFREDGQAFFSLPAPSK